MWDSLTTRPFTDETWTPLAITYLIVFLVGFVAAVFLYNDGGRMLTTNPILRRYLRRAGGYLLIPLSIGLFFVGVRALEIDPFTFSRPIWLLLSAIGLLVTCAILLAQARRSYDSEMSAYQRDIVKRRYLNPTPAVGARPRRSRR